jgi:hypothetical protein
MAKTYSLIWLDDNLRRSGIAGRCFKYELSAAKDCLHIVYLDRYLQEQFIAVFRTSRLCYRIYYSGKFVTARTVKAATVRMSGILTDIITESEYYSVMTVAEYMSLDTLTHKNKLELFRRLENKKYTDV